METEDRSRKEIFYDEFPFRNRVFKIYFLADYTVLYTTFSSSPPSWLDGRDPSHRSFFWATMISDYLSGRPVDLSAISVDASYTPSSRFQKAVWHACRSLRYGERITYSSFSKRFSLGSPRSVGTALSKNPIPLFIPCHRVIGKDGLGGFMGKDSGDEVSLKQSLLDLETPKNI